jgi:hypothetical protein
VVGWLFSQLFVVRFDTPDSDQALLFEISNTKQITLLNTSAAWIAFSSV